MVGRSWMPNTLPRMYLNSKPIYLVVRSMVLPRKDIIFIVPRPLQNYVATPPLCPHVVRSFTFCTYIFLSHLFLLLILMFPLILLQTSQWIQVLEARLKKVAKDLEKGVALRQHFKSELQSLVDLIHRLKIAQAMVEKKVETLVKRVEEVNLKVTEALSVVTSKTAEMEAMK